MPKMEDPPNSLLWERVIRLTWEGGALGGVEEGWSTIVKKRGPGPSKQDHADGLVVVGLFINYIIRSEQTRSCKRPGGGRRCPYSCLQPQRGGLGGVYNSARRSQRTKEEKDKSESLIYLIVTFVVFYFCDFSCGTQCLKRCLLTWKRSPKRKYKIQI